jgi:hypothetical protein
MKPLDLNSDRVSSRRLGRALTHLYGASRQLEAACHSATDRYHQKQLRRLAVDLRTLSEPIAGLATFLERGGGR